MFTLLIVGLVSQVQYVNTYQPVYFKYVTDCMLIWLFLKSQQETRFLLCVSLKLGALEELYRDERVGRRNTVSHHWSITQNTHPCPIFCPYP